MLYKNTGGGQRSDKLSIFTSETHSEPLRPMETSAHIKYLLANEQDNRWGVVVTTTGYQIIEPQTSYPPSNHPVRYLFSVEKGRLLNEYQLIYKTS